MQRFLDHKCHQQKKSSFLIWQWGKLNFSEETSNLINAVVSKWNKYNKSFSCLNLELL